MWLFLYVLFIVGTAVAQDPDTKWQRVVTSPDANIDVSTSSLLLESTRIISARFRTTLSKSEMVGGTTGAKFKTRIETIQFSANDSKYRIADARLLDSSGKIVFASANEDPKAGWKPMKGGTAQQLYGAACQLPPFGPWKVISYRFADGSRNSIKDAPELLKLVGTELYLSFDSIHFNDKSCMAPVFELGDLSNEEFVQRVGSNLKALGVMDDKASSLVLRCNSNSSFPPQSWMVLPTDGKTLFLWDGVFLELERVNSSGSSFLKLITINPVKSQ